MPITYHLIYQFAGKKEVTLDLNDIQLAHALRGLASELDLRHDFLRSEPGPALTLHVGVQPAIVKHPRGSRQLPPHQEFRPGLAPGVPHPHLPPGVPPDETPLG